MALFELFILNIDAFASRKYGIVLPFWLTSEQMIIQLSLEKPNNHQRNSRARRERNNRPQKLEQKKK
jgi:hypothetical protein